MSLTSEGMSPADIAAVCGGNRGGDGFGGNNGWWVIIILLALFGENGFGFGGNRNGNGGGMQGYSQPIVIDSGKTCGGSSCATQADLSAGFANSAVLRNLNDLSLGQASIQQTLCQGFGGVNTALVQQGYETRLATQGIQAQLAQCCCDTGNLIQANTTQGVMNTNTLSRQIADCCCDMEKANMQNRFDAQAYNCNTLQAIDKLGDRIIDYMSNEKIQALRDENQVLRFQASQTAQNAYIAANQDAQTAELIRRLGRDCPVPAYVVPNPNCCYQPVSFNTCNTGCGCGGSF